MLRVEVNEMTFRIREDGEEHRRWSKLPRLPESRRRTLAPVTPRSGVQLCGLGSCGELPERDSCRRFQCSLPLRRL